jgi:CHAT domain-containing protein
LDQLRYSSAGAPAPRGKSCPEEEALLRLAAGLAGEEEARAMMEHVGSCDHCGPLLATAVEDFNTELNSEEAAFASVLPSSSPAGQREMAARLSQSAAPSKVAARWWRWWPVWAVAGLAVAAAGVWWIRYQSGTKPVDRLLASAYTEQRTLEPRIAGAQYGPLWVTRGGVPSQFSRPPALFEGEARIARELAAHPANPAWLDAKARADLLTWHFEAAIESLDEAISEQPASSAFLTDLATAYFERAEATGRMLDYGSAIEILGRVLAKTPDDPVALFNRALSAERILLLHQAEDDWKHYLKVDRRSGWAEEATRHLAEVERKLKDSSSTEYTHGDEGRVGQVVTSGIGRSLDSARELAVVLEERHHDSWLSDLLRQVNKPSFRPATDALAEAARANAAGNPSSGEKAARVAIAEFAKDSNIAGESRARFELVYALHRSSRGAACLDEVVRAMPASHEHGWLWIEAQFLLEKASCLNFAHKFDEALDSARTAEAAARKAEYPVLFLRCLGGDAGQLNTIGRESEAWNLDAEGLKRYFQGSYPPLRAQEFYNSMSFAAERLHEWRLAQTLAREAVGAIAQTGNRSGEGIARVKWGNAATLAGDGPVAHREIEAGLRILNGLEPSPATEFFRIDSEIRLARLDIETGGFGYGSGRLRGAERRIAALSNHILEARYYRALAALSLRENRPEAEHALLSAVGISETGLAGLPDSQERLAWLRENEDAYRELTRFYLDRRDPDDAFAAWEWARGGRATLTVAGAAGSRRSTAPSLEMWKASLPRLDGIIEVTYFETENGLAIWASDNRSTHCFRAEMDRDQVHRLVAAFRKACSDPASGPAVLAASGQRLYSAILAPVAAWLSPQQELVIEPDGELRAVPFAALPAPGGGRLGARYRLILSDSRYDLAPRQTVQTAVAHTLIASAPALNGSLAAEFPPLHDAELEAQDVARNFVSPTVLTGPGLTQAALERELPRSTVFHFAGHAISGAGRTGLLISGGEDGPGAWWSPEAIARMPLVRCHLVFLAACETAVEASDDPDSLVRAFVSAGVSSVIASQWNVDSHATRELIGVFYKELLAGKDPPTALQRAEEQLSRAPATSHPYYWAAFSVYGKP